MLTQPYTDVEESADSFSTKMSNSYIPSAHVKFLEASGARVVPVNYRLRTPLLNKLLGQLNGVYIPGDNIDILDNEKYIDTVTNIITFA